MRRLFFPTAAAVTMLSFIAVPTLGASIVGAPPPSPVPVGDPTTTLVPPAPPPTVPGDPAASTIPGSPVPTAPPTTQQGIRSVVLTGHGYGHGRGLGQWGAYGYAVDKGWDYRRILQHFYGNTSPGNISPDSQLAVRLTAHDSKPLTVYQSTGQIWLGVNGLVTGPRPGDGFGTPLDPNAPPPAPVAPTEPPTTLAANKGPVPVGVITTATLPGEVPSSVVDPGATTTTLVPAPPVGWSTRPPGSAAVVRITMVSPGTFTISEAASCAGPFTVRSTVAAPSVAVSLGPVPPKDDPTNALQVCYQSGARRAYRGDLVAVDGKPNQYAVSRVNMEEYLRGVVPAEVPASWGTKPNGMETLKAQAVAARSYATAERRSGFANTCDTTACQVYLGRGEFRALGYQSYEDPKTDEAIAATKTEVRVDASGKPARTEFSSSTGGHTAGGAFPAVVDEGDATAPNPHSKWTVTLSAQRLEAGRKLGAFRDLVVVLRDGVGPYGGRVQNLVLKFEKGDIAMKSGEFLRTYNLRSVLFDVKVLDSNTVAAQGLPPGVTPETIPADGTTGGGVGVAGAPVAMIPDASISSSVTSTVPATKPKKSKSAKTTVAKKSRKATTTAKTSAAGNPETPPATKKTTKAVAAGQKPKTSVESPPTSRPPTTVKATKATTSVSKKKVAATPEVIGVRFLPLPVGA